MTIHKYEKLIKQKLSKYQGPPLLARAVLDKALARVLSEPVPEAISNLVYNFIFESGIGNKEDGVYPEHRENIKNAVNAFFREMSEKARVARLPPKPPYLHIVK